MKIDKQLEDYWKDHPLHKRFKPSECGHRYPYLVRWFDDWSDSGKMIERRCYCFICKKVFITRIHPKVLDVENLDFGYDRTMSGLKKELPKLIKKYKKNVFEQKSEGEQDGR